MFVASIKLKEIDKHKTKILIEFNKLNDVVLLKPNNLLKVSFDSLCYGVGFFELGLPT